jgi:hypothetical protein
MVLTMAGPPNAAQKADLKVAQMERKAAELGADVRAAGSEVRQAADEAVDTVAHKLSDAAITTQVNAGLARGPWRAVGEARHRLARLMPRIRGPQPPGPRGVRHSRRW